MGGVLYVSLNFAWKMSVSEIKPKIERGLLRSSAVVGLMTMLSRVLGLVRDVVIAGYFGATDSADAFFVAFKIPNFLRRLFAEGAFSQAFVPVLSEYRTQRDHSAVKALVDRVAGALGSVLLMVTLVAMLGAPLLTALFAPGFYLSGGEKFDLAADMLRITFPYLALISLTALSGAILNSYERFAVPAFTPVLLNLTLIGFAVLLSPWFDPPILSLAWGVMAAGVVQLLFQVPFLMRLRLLPSPCVDKEDPGVKRIMQLMLPALFGVSITQINLLLDTVLASFLETGSVSWLYYSDRLSELPLGVFGIAIATVILPSLSRRHAGQNSEQFAKTLDWALRMVLLIGVPSSLALFILAGPMIVSLFHYGELTDRDVLMSMASLQAYASGILAFMMIKIFAAGYFSRQDMKTPVKIGIQAAVANMVFNLILIFPLQHVGLAAATSASAFLNAGLLLYGLHRHGVWKWQQGWRPFTVRLLVANLVMVLLLVWLAQPLQSWLDASLFERVEWMAVLVLSGLSAYLFTLWALGVRLSQLKAVS